MTFEPHPREFFAPKAAPPRLSTLRAKLELLRAYGVAIAYVARFDARLASLTAGDFVRDVLEQGMHAQWVLVGEDFRFGRGRQGDLAFLRTTATRFSVESMRTVDVEGQRASSTAVRTALTGIFAVRVHGIGAAPRRGVASVGVRPTVKVDAKPLLEVFMLDFDESIYGRRITVEFLHKLRDEERFPDVDTLKRAIAHDVVDARNYFAARG